MEWLSTNLPTCSLIGPELLFSLHRPRRLLERALMYLSARVRYAQLLTYNSLII
jgi:hypothetical protein